MERRWKIRMRQLQSPLLCLSFRRHATTKLGRIIKARANVSPLLGEMVGVRGNRALAVSAAFALDSASDNRPKGHVALSHSSFQAGFAGDR